MHAILLLKEAKVMITYWTNSCNLCESNNSTHFCNQFPGLSLNRGNWDYSFKVPNYLFVYSISIEEDEEEISSV